MNNYSELQLKFLALLKIFEQPVHIDILGILVPLLPGPFMDLIEKGKEDKILIQHNNSYLEISKNISDNFSQCLNKIINKTFLNEIIDKIYKNKIDEKIDKTLLSKLHFLVGDSFKSAEIDIEIAHDYVKSNNLEKAKDLLFEGVKKLFNSHETLEAKSLFINSCLELSNLSFILGTGFHDMDKYLVKAQELSLKVGDTRSHALTNLHLGRLYYFTDRRDDALIAFSLGSEEIKDIGDDDILIQAAVFLGIFYLLKGLLKEAIKYFELAENAIETGKTSILKVPTGPLFLGYCAIYLGDFHKAIGNLDYYWRKAKEQLSLSVASTFRVGLGTVLALLKRFKEAEYHLYGAREEALKFNNALAAYFAGGSLALINFFKGNIEKAYEILKETVEFGSSAGLHRQFTSPWILEMIYEFEKHGFEPLPNFKFSELKDIILNGVNIHMQGVCYRLIAQEKMLNNESRNEIIKYLKKSEKLLEKSGDRLELAKTLFELARLEAVKKNVNNAKTIVYRARRLLGGYINEFFPAEFNKLIEKKDKISINENDTQKNFLKNYLEIIESLYPLESKDEISQKLLSITTDMFGAERSGIFCINGNKLELKVAFNLTEQEIKSKKFSYSSSIIKKTFKTGKPQKVNLSEKSKSIKSILCVPLKSKNIVKSVIYYDNLYLDNAFDFINLQTLEQLSKHISLIIERRFKYINLKEQRDILSLEKQINIEKEDILIAKSDKMLKLIEKIDKIANSDSTVLIIGETGTGKELIAKRIHEKSPRKKYPFVVVDCTTIPENLIESELFGHEKGAFTGADKRKVGRVELAHRGTLFIDEIGELSLNAQTKLLRVLQEKHFTKVGGTKIIESDFRLIAATNRDLKNEVKEGRFREDLFYRLNVIPIIVPPLRERKEDISFLAKHFLDYYSTKYNKYGLKLTKTQEKLLMEYNWPGNVRELRNVIERAVLLSENNNLNIEIFPRASHTEENLIADLPTLKELERRYINYVLKITDGKIGGKGGAAEILGLKRTTLYSKMKILGMN